MTTGLTCVLHANMHAIHTRSIPFFTKTHLVHDRCTSVDDDRLDAGVVAELACLLVDLAGQLTRGCQDEGEGHGLCV